MVAEAAMTRVDSAGVDSVVVEAVMVEEGSVEAEDLVVEVDRDHVFPPTMRAHQRYPRRYQIHLMHTLM